jgi:hypothetical protein
MNIKSLRSVLVFLVLFPILGMTISTPAQAIITTLNPTDSIVSSSNDTYTATLDPTGGPTGGFFFLNITIPAGYTLVLPASGNTVGNYTMLNKTSGTNKVIINIISATNDPNGYLVNVNYSTDYGAHYGSSNNQNISNMAIDFSGLKITKPTASTAGYMNISLDGRSGPIDPTNNTVTITLAKGTLKNPSTPGAYTWYLEAKNSPTGTAYTSSNVVNITKPPVVTNPGANPAIILNDNGRARAPGTNRTTINVTVTGIFPIANVTIDLTPIGGPANAQMTHTVGNVYSITTNATSGINLTNNLVVNATDTSGNFNNSVSVQLTVLRRGDVVRDNAVKGSDALFIRRFVVGLETMTPQQLFVADVTPATSSGVVTGADALYIRRFVVGLEAEP